MTVTSITSIICIFLLLFSGIIAVISFLWGRRSNYKELCQHFDHEIDTHIRRHASNCPGACMHQPLQEINTHIDKRQIGELLNVYMEQHYPQFMNDLRNYTKNTLTPTEELICIFSKLVMRNKQVADALRISLSSVTKTRYRVKTKIGLTNSEDLDEWVRKCGEPISTLPPRRIFYTPDNEETSIK